MIAPRFKLAATAAYSGSRDIATSAERPGRGPVLSARNAPGQLTLPWGVVPAAPARQRLRTG
ncbi:hypothetical protein [Methylibium sp. Root1272]|uniref:hypothetical protein n=1 Tax=Methylibium sp. Root1272 TaxID=1736441 RepID=UPI000AE9EA82|nr:hypothetical protein [Methylibium sp. Root1272]